MVTLLIIIFLLATFLFIYLKEPEFGKEPSGKRLESIKKSPNFKNGKFENIHKTPQITEGYNYFEVFIEFFLKKQERKIPADIIPSVTTNLLTLAVEEDILVWFGHSSYFIQIKENESWLILFLAGMPPLFSEQQNHSKERIFIQLMNFP